MKSVLILLAVTLSQCVLQLNCYKFRDSDLIPARFMRKADHQQQYHLDDLLLSSSNRQRSLYQDAEPITSNYQKALDAIAAAASSTNQDQYSEELHLDDFIQNDDDDDDMEDIDLRMDPKDEETETHSSLIAGHQYVSGGAGEGKQHLQPDGTVDNKEEIKSDEDLPAYCDPPNPCPVGYQGDDCDLRPYTDFTAEFSKSYQEQQNCMCDDDHNDCQHHQKSAQSNKGGSKSMDKVNEMISNINLKDKKFSGVVAKKSPRIRRDLSSRGAVKNSRKNPYTNGKAIKIHVAKKSAPTK